jgi:hypothetical protein
MRSNHHHHNGLRRAGLFLLAVCAIAVAHVAQAQNAVGTVSSASGGVQIQRGAAILPATPGMPVNLGDRIGSGVEGIAVITLSDGSKLELRPSTDITLDQFTSGGATPTRISLAAGVLKSTVKKTRGESANYQVHTPNAILTARGTIFYTSYTSSSPQTGNLPGVSHYTEVAVLEGTVNLAQASAPQGGVQIAQGTTGTVSGGNAPDSHKREFPCSPPPTSKDQCKDGGWRQFGNCGFKNQGQCVSFVEHENH